MSYKVVGNSSRIILGILQGIGLLLLLVFLTMLSKYTLVKFLDMVVYFKPHASGMKLSGLCHDYFWIVKWHVGRLLVGCHLKQHLH